MAYQSALKVWLVVYTKDKPSPATSDGDGKSGVLRNVIRVILTGDELSALEVTKHILVEFSNVIVVGMHTAKQEALDVMEKKQPDAVFIDISLSAENGLGLAQEMASKYPEIKAVFISAYKKYAIKAFDTGAVDFLLKPLQKERLEKTLGKLDKRWPTAIKTSGTVKIQCIHKFMVYTPSGEPLRFRTKKTEEMAALLVHYGQREVSKDKMVDLLWPELDEKKASALFYTTLYNLKKALGALNGGMELTKSSGGYRLYMRDTLVDVTELEQSLHRLKRLGNGSNSELEQVLKLYTDSYFGDDAYPWAEDKRLDLQNAVTAMLMDIGQFYHRKALWANAAYALENLLRFDDMHEAAYEMLVRCLHKAGDTGRMHRVYGRYQTVLKELDLPCKPLDELCLD